jgi:hypothetical protein
MLIYGISHFRWKKCKLVVGVVGIPCVIYMASRLEYYIIISPLVVFESMTHKHLFCPSSRVRCYGELLGVNCFLPIKDVSLKVKIVSTSLDLVE